MELDIKWQKEIELYRKFKTTFILEGEVLDKQPSIDDEEYSLMTLDQYLYNKLKSIGYGCVVFFNHVDGFYNVFDSQNIKDFRQLIKEVEKSKDDADDSLNHDGRTSKFGDATDKIRKVMRNKSMPVAIILDTASRYITSSDRLQQDEQYFYTELFLATQKMNTSESKINNEILNNLIFLICDKINDIPIWFYISNPMVRSLHVSLPNKELRNTYLEEYLETFYGYEQNVKDLSKDKLEKIKKKFVDLTDGFRNIDLNALRDLMQEKHIFLEDIDRAITLYKYGVEENPWDDKSLVDRLPNIHEEIHKYVKGQDICVNQTVDIITRAIYGLSGVQHSSSNSKPKGIMFFAGPSGTGKTELAKSIARWLFSTEEACIRFDMSEYSQSHSDQRLLGAPPGYVGYEAGGMLTNAVKAKPFSVLLFDEIEKADTSIFDKFLQILEDGRMTDGKGETVYFSDTIIIFTSNLGVSKKNPVTHEVTPIISYEDSQKPDYKYNEFKKKVLDAISFHFNNVMGRPEIQNRIGDNFIIFEYIKEDVGMMIAKSQIEKIATNLKKQKSIELTISDEAFDNIREIVIKHLEQGGRGVGNALEKCLINPLARYLANNRIIGNTSVNIQKIEEKDSIYSLVCK